MLTDRFPMHTIADRLLPAEAWQPFPKASERDAWTGLPILVREGLIAAGEEALEREWPSLPAHLFLEFVRSGDRSVYESRSFPRRSALAALVLAECSDGRGRFLDAVVDAVWSLCEESFWGVSAHLHMQQAGPGLPDVGEPVVDLFAAETGALLAWTDYLLGTELGSVSPLIVPRIRAELVRRILDPCLLRDDFWWMGTNPKRALNNWTPWICSNWLASCLLCEADPDRRIRGVAGAMACLERFLAQQPADGGCDEGPGYWGRAGASTFECLELLHSATAGTIDLYQEPLVRNLGSFLHKVHIDGDWFVNFADAGARINIPAGLVCRFGSATGDDALYALGAYALARGRDRDLKHRPSLPRALPDLFWAAETPDPGGTPVPAYVRDAWLPNLQVMTARCRAGTASGFFVAAKGGHNSESHNHNDVGNVIVFLDGHPVLVDAGVETYTARTFSAERYDIWTMQSAYHNLPTFGEWAQKPGRGATADHVSYHCDEEIVRFSIELARAYPEQAGISNFRRELVFRRGKRIDITDSYALRNALPVVLALMTPCTAHHSEAGSVELMSGGPEAGGGPRARIVVTPDPAKISCEPLAADDARMRPVWPAGLTRILLQWPAAASGRVTVSILPPDA